MRCNAPTRMVSDWGSVTPFVTNQITGRNGVLSAGPRSDCFRSAHRSLGEGGSRQAFDGWEAVVP
jgi:hypothetical protein